jgi:hypothetical protein
LSSCRSCSVPRAQAQLSHWIPPGYDKEVYNGDIGYIDDVDTELGELTASFDRRAVTYGFGDLDTLVPAHAATIHKTQDVNAGGILHRRAGEKAHAARRSRGLDEPVASPFIFRMWTWWVFAAAMAVSPASRSGLCRDGPQEPGSEYPAVVIPVMTQHYAMLQRNRLYTGVIRSKRLFVLMRQKKAVAIAVENLCGRRRWPKLT